MISVFFNVLWLSPVAKASEASFNCFGEEGDQPTLSLLGLPEYDPQTNSLSVSLEQCDPSFENEKVLHACFLGPSPYSFMLIVRRTGPATLYYSDESIDLSCRSDSEGRLNPPIFSRYFPKR
jgi:hypothetical protein